MEGNAPPTRHREQNKISCFHFRSSNNHFTATITDFEFDSYLYLSISKQSRVYYVRHHFYWWKIIDVRMCVCVALCPSPSPCMHVVYSTSTELHFIFSMLSHTTGAPIMSTILLIVHWIWSVINIFNSNSKSSNDNKEQQPLRVPHHVPASPALYICKNNTKSIDCKVVRTDLLKGKIATQKWIMKYHSAKCKTARIGSSRGTRVHL